ncbi:2-amino-4-hydroxy-6-hydroxymethyldihydropteridine diphosphokinase [Alicyclobacillus macrosporangiidus]|jgi:2-amino-4-hydroxy-6-hydroxymethyldihydropteridine diphosphokinase|uniref:2-amino-4-hydroxy-6-hydroxymethyldihydropteridine diphosphokinase n=1 Tax=Alicyclobacillus macrosporangiidus TaxID=392015 RepID=A0A1I7KQC3_9BACL|nr:2-amino-4-hydroxy-6-hydroxymethyldihydropteridine diphosphokinase [Alicyclobacillus macrosporangiidus]SFU99574.1 2-amino-4-hydroxy-6-hydroxymethyldihydropteridinediphosphokinase [Alicyclobacillus macrosporangiidus]
MCGSDPALHTVYLGLGSNQGSRVRNLLGALDELQRMAVGPVACSRVYETRPVGYLQQPDFLNLVVRMQVTLRPLPLLGALHAIEQRFGRVREVRFGPRTLDVDILLYDREYVCFRTLQIPHPRMWTRGFVLIPLADLAPGLRGPGGRTVREMADAMAKDGGVRDVGRIC